MKNTIVLFITFFCSFFTANASSLGSGHLGLDWGFTEIERSNAEIEGYSLEFNSNFNLWLHDTYGADLYIDFHWGSGFEVGDIDIDHELAKFDMGVTLIKNFDFASLFVNLGGSRVTFQDRDNNSLYDYKGDFSFSPGFGAEFKYDKFKFTPQVDYTDFPGLEDAVNLTFPIDYSVSDHIDIGVKYINFSADDVRTGTPTSSELSSWLFGVDLVF